MSFFPRVDYAAVKPKVAGEPDFSHYPDNAEVAVRSTRGGTDRKPVSLLAPDRAGRRGKS